MSNHSIEDPALTMLREEMERRTTASADLLRRYAGLTRRMQREEIEHGGLSASSETRDQRDALEAEILRRMTTQRSPKDIPCRTCGAGMDDRCYMCTTDGWGPTRGRHYHARRIEDAER